MKTWLFGSIFVILVLFSLFVMTSNTTSDPRQNYQPTQSGGDDPSLRGLKIN